MIKTAVDRLAALAQQGCIPPAIRQLVKLEVYVVVALNFFPKIELFLVKPFFRRCLYSHALTEFIQPYKLAFLHNEYKCLETNNIYTVQYHSSGVRTC